MMSKRHYFRIAVMIISILIFSAAPGFSEDSEMNRATLVGLQLLRVSVENMQPNIQPYAEKHGLTAKQIESDVVQKLGKSGIKTASDDTWLSSTGRPILYVNINTHETEKYWYAYNIKLELRQLVCLSANPKITTLAPTWSTNITGIANIGNLHIIKDDLMVLVDSFLKAYKAVNQN